MSAAVSSAVEIPSLPGLTASSPGEAIVGDLIHELRQPLSAMESIAYYLTMVVPQHDARIRRQAERLEQLVHQTAGILADALHLAQAQPPRPQIIDLHELILEAAAERGRAGRQSRVSLAAEPALAALDPVHARRLVDTLLSLTGGGPLETRIVDSEIVLEARLPLSPSSLGLAVVRSIAESHSGTAEQRPGESATLLLVRLPRAA